MFTDLTLNTTACLYEKILPTASLLNSRELGHNSTYLDSVALWGPPLTQQTFQKSAGTHFYRLYGAISQTRLCHCESKLHILVPFSNRHVLLHPCDTPILVGVKRYNTPKKKKRKKRKGFWSHSGRHPQLTTTFQAVSLCKTHTYTIQKRSGSNEKLWPFSVRGEWKCYVILT